MFLVKLFYLYNISDKFVRLLWINSFTQIYLWPFMAQNTDCLHLLSGQSYKASTIVIYDSRVVPDLKIPHITTLES